VDFSSSRADKEQRQGETNHTKFDHFFPVVIKGTGLLGQQVHFPFVVCRLQIIAVSQQHFVLLPIETMSLPMSS